MQCCRRGCIGPTPLDPFLELFGVLWLISSDGVGLRSILTIPSGLAFFCFSSFVCLVFLSYFIFIFPFFFIFASIYLLFTNAFCLMKFTGNSKKREKLEISDNHCFKSYFWYELVNFRNHILASMLRFKLLDF